MKTLRSRYETTRELQALLLEMATAFVVPGSNADFVKGLRIRLAQAFEAGLVGSGRLVGYIAVLPRTDGWSLAVQRPVPHKVVMAALVELEDQWAAEASKFLESAAQDDACPNCRMSRSPAL